MRESENRRKERRRNGERDQRIKEIERDLFPNNRDPDNRSVIRDYR